MDLREKVRLLHVAAQRIRLYSYAPYSKFRVGAALMTDRGTIFAGTNVEAADYDATHAEESAISAMIGAGEKFPVLVLVLGGLLGRETSLVLPCGKCRQKLYEFSRSSGKDILVVTEIPLIRKPKCITIAKLLPMAFGPADLRADRPKAPH